MGGEGVAGGRLAVPLVDRLRHLAREHAGAQRQIAAAQPFGDGHQVRLDAVMFQGAPGAAAAGAAHHLVGDHQHAVAVADVADTAGIAVGGGNGAAGGTHHRLEDEGGDAGGAEAADLVVELLRAVLGHVLRRHARRRAVGVDGRKAAYLQQGAEIGRLALQETGDRKRSQRVAVPRALAGDEAAARHLAAGGVILQRQLQAGFHRFRAAGGEDDVLEVAARPGADGLGQFLGRVVAEVEAIGEGDLLQLGADGLAYLLVAVADAGGGRPAGGVDVTPAVPIPEVDALAAGDPGKGGEGVFDHAGLPRAAAFLRCRCHIIPSLSALWPVAGG